MPLFALAQAARARRRQLGPGSSTEVPTSSRLVADATVVGKIVLLILLIFSAISWAVIFYKIWAFRRAEQQIGDVPRRVPQEREVLRSAGRLPHARGEPARRAVSVRLCGAEHAAAHRHGPMPAKPAAAAARPTLKSLDAVDRALLRATTVELNKLEHRVPFLATTASITPFIGLFGTVWGIVIAFQGIASAGNTSLGVVAQPHRRGADCDGGGTVRGDTGGVFLQPLHQQGEEVRVGDGRLLAGVPEHLRAELHVSAESVQLHAESSADRRWRRRTARARRARGDVARRDQRRPARRRDARAAGDLHGHRADDAAGAERQPAAGAARRSAQRAADLRDHPGRFRAAAVRADRRGPGPLRGVERARAAGDPAARQTSRCSCGWTRPSPRRISTASSTSSSAPASTRWRSPPDRRRAGRCRKPSARFCTSGRRLEDGISRMLLLSIGAHIAHRRRRSG